MAERRPQSSAATRGPSVRRNLFHQHLSRRPTTSSTSTSAETLRLDIDTESGASDIVIRDSNGDYEIGGLNLPSLDEPEEEGCGADGREDERERQKLADAVKLHQRDRNRPLSEPAELLEAVRASLRAKTAALEEDNWMYEAEDDSEAR